MVRGRWKKRAPHLATQKFHDDCAAESGWLVHLHAFWEFEGPRSFATTTTDDSIRRFFEEEFPDAVPLMPALTRGFQNKSNRFARDHPLRTLVLYRTRLRSSAMPPTRSSRSTVKE